MSCSSWQSSHLASVQDERGVRGNHRVESKSNKCKLRKIQQTVIPVQLPSNPQFNCHHSTHLLRLPRSFGGICIHWTPAEAEQRTLNQPCLCVGTTCLMATRTAHCANHVMLKFNSLKSRTLRVLSKGMAEGEV